MLHSRMLRYLDEVARRGTIRQAAERLNVTASSINRQIIELEAEIGAPIFERLPRRMRLTAAGEALISHVRRTLRDHERMRHHILELEGVGRGSVTVATMNGLASGLIPQLCVTFERDHPGVRFKVVSLLGPEILQAVAEGEVDFGLGYNLADKPNLQVLDRLRMPLGVVMRPDHPLAAKGTVRLTDCAGLPFVLSDQTMSIRRSIDVIARRAGLDLNIVYTTNSIEMMKFIVAKGGGLTCMSQPDIVEEQRRGTLVFRRISDRYLPPGEIKLVQRANAQMGATARLFIEEVRSALQPYSVRGE